MKVGPTIGSGKARDMTPPSGIVHVHRNGVLLAIDADADGVCLSWRSLDRRRRAVKVCEWTRWLCGRVATAMP